MSNLKFKAEITNYADAERFLDGKSSRLLCYKTRVHRLRSDEISVVHHQTAIVTYHADGMTELWNGGWHSSTTTNRLHRLTPYGVWVSMKQWVTYVTIGDVTEPLTRPYIFHPEDL